MKEARSGGGRPWSRADAADPLERVVPAEHRALRPRARRTSVAMRTTSLP